MKNICCILGVLFLIGCKQRVENDSEVLAENPKMYQATIESLKKSLPTGEYEGSNSRGACVVKAEFQENNYEFCRQRVEGCFQLEVEKNFAPFGQKNFEIKKFEINGKESFIDAAYLDDWSAHIQITHGANGKVLGVKYIYSRLKYRIVEECFNLKKVK